MLRHAFVKDRTNWVRIVYRTMYKLQTICGTMNRALDAKVRRDKTEQKDNFYNIVLVNAYA